jgi:hypothetical protein
VLRASRRLLRPGGRTAYFTIFVAPGVSKRDHRRAVRSNREPSDLLDAAGFDDVEVIDLTESFLETARGWYEHTSELERDLRATTGDAAFDQQQADRREMVTAIEEGLLSRALFLAARPDLRSTMKRSE